MKRIVTLLTALVLTCGVTYGQEPEPGPGFEHLKCYGPFIGNWRYEGPLLESLDGLAEKDTDIVIEITRRRILNKSAIEVNWSILFKGGAEVVGKDLIGWNAEKNEIVLGSMSSDGGISLGTATPDEVAKTLTLDMKGVDGKGEETSSKTLLTKTGKDTFTWQALERTGGLAEGQSPVYTFKRVERKKKAAN